MECPRQSHLQMRTVTHRVESCLLPETEQQVVPAKTSSEDVCSVAAAKRDLQKT